MNSALYRTWRPQHFSDLVGQDVVRTTLCGAVSQGRVGHAYLFTGPRGTGKTSTARILARAVNCLDPSQGEPCDACAPCRAILDGSCLDLTEIDAASHTGVDSVRDLIAQLPYRPTLVRRKVLTIDEVHGLSAAAFNALLKSLEEPPAHIMFVLATTELHKVPATVTSRCQRLDFRPLATDQIRTRLAQVATGEGLTCAAGALDLLAEHATGSLRDGLALLDQVRSFADADLDEATARAALGLPPRARLDALTSAIAGADLGQALGELDMALREADAHMVGKALVSHFHSVLRLAAGATEASASAVTRHQAQALGPQRALAILSALQRERSVRSWSGQVHLEMAVTTACLEGVAGASTITTTEAAAPMPGRPPAEPTVPQPAPPTQARPKSTPAPQARTMAPQSAPAQDTSRDERAGSNGQPPTPAGTGDHAALWQRALEILRREAGFVAGLCAAGTVLGLDGDTFRLGFSTNYYYTQVESRKNHDIITAALTAAAGRPLHLVCCRWDASQGPDPVAALHEDVLQRVRARLGTSAPAPQTKTTPEPLDG